jgi:hypothetical protein
MAQTGDILLTLRPTAGDGGKGIIAMGGMDET